MSEAFNLAVGALAGIVLGGCFFGGLWWTVKKGVAIDNAAPWFLGSFVLRTAVVLLGLYVVAAGSWQRLLAALLGFFVARFVVMWVTRGVPLPRPHAAAQDTPHAP